MTTRIYFSGNRLLVVIEGRFVLDECEAFKKAVVASLSPAVTHVLIDLSKNDFIDSSGLGTLVGLKMRTNQIKARLTLINPSPQTLEVLVMSKLNEIFEIATGQEAQNLIGGLAAESNLVRTVGMPSSTAAPAIPSVEGLKISDPTRPRDGVADEVLQDLCRKASEALIRGNLDESVRLYREAIARNANYLPAHNNLAIVYEKRPEWRRLAIEEWETVLRLSSQSGDLKDKERAERHLATLRE
ncbi:MAG: STAS domain-containing protein [Candidatus Sumerlaeia bacterium]|nr:STAS domain-containing protein [Candidatus Sumerlaeia bacterium]